MYFPALLDLRSKKVLVVGGGKIAREKVARLLDFTGAITIIAPQCDQELAALIQRHQLTYHPRPYRKGDIDGFFLVVVAVDDLALQEAIFHEARGTGVLVNSVDSVDLCDFIFPSYIKRGDLVIAFSTGGASPSLAKYLRRAFERLLPPDIGDFVASLKRLRASLPKGKERMKLLDRKARDYVQRHFGGADV
ncbi:MAG: siroheme synthase [Nitratiruptor sp.]|nr:siroheme synthase [Nitratiruptor sp.]NPA83503.1 bifunctional precorrin-2 dehydrogenase/sirohydrochlorin ferrochelatase [Campylobacterota bacterium]